MISVETLLAVFFRALQFWKNRFWAGSLYPSPLRWCIIIYRQMLYHHFLKSSGSISIPDICSGIEKRVLCLFGSSFWETDRF
jgi:hypothetical protein